jgi:enamine deaminase RidA (YjgF/YER057c/UK114 family)
MNILQPPGWARPKGFSHGIAASGRHVAIAGQIGCDAEGRVLEKTFAGQFRQTLKNIVAVLAEAGGRPEHIVRLTWYVLDLKEYAAALRDIGAAYRDVIGKHYPAMAVVQVSGLVDPGARLEIEAAAVIPERQAEQP